MTFPTVKSNPWGLPRRKRPGWLWTELHWRSLVLGALRAEATRRRMELARLCSFRFTTEELGVVPR